MDERKIRQAAARLASQAADDVEEYWINPLNEFLTARTSTEAGQLLDRYPQLLTPRVVGLVHKFITEANEKGDWTGMRHLEERRRIVHGRR